MWGNRQLEISISALSLILWSVIVVLDLHLKDDLKHFLCKDQCSFRQGQASQEHQDGSALSVGRSGTSFLDSSPNIVTSWLPSRVRAWMETGGGEELLKEAPPFINTKPRGKVLLLSTSSTQAQGFISLHIVL